jgi:hypothetical protein
VREQERDKTESEEEILERETGTEGRSVNVPLLLAIEANTLLKVGIGRKALFLYKKAKNNCMLHLLMFRGCNRCWYVHWVNGDHNRGSNSALGVG